MTQRFYIPDTDTQVKVLEAVAFSFTERMYIQIYLAVCVLKNAGENYVPARALNLVAFLV